MAEGLTEEQTRGFSEAFDGLDTNHTGFLAPFELGILMRSLGHPLTEEETRTLTADGMVTKSDFLGIMAEREQDVALQEKLVNAFKVFDRDSSGFINTDLTSEFMTQMTSLGPAPYTKEEFEMFMSEYMAIEPVISRGGQGSAAEDGEVDYQELVRLMLKK
uniref:EF-hand domain-containing protein n=1 Tax=Strombidinopsis acuminata TaxID=141414 RepID=A0A7S3WT29_9SPIT|mmetsp:Transcript_8467/g.21786  ORF Transcript_8467/g.21786 Transcript_8467/m.21786 type:complete len:161 (-) Transcript_8467:179-661(-)